MTGGNSFENTKITIKKGTFNGDLAFSNYKSSAPTTSETITISGGKFNHAEYGIYSYAESQNIEISGGTYDASVYSDWIKNGHYAQLNADDTYTVKNTCDVTFNSNGGSEVTAKSVSYNNVVSAPIAPTREGYAFAGWYLGENLYDFTVPVEEDIILTAKWDEIGKGVEIAPSISVDIIVNQNSETTIPTTSTENTGVKVSDDKTTVTITDTSTGVQMEVKFAGSAYDSTGSAVVGTVSEVSVKYPEKPAQSDSEVTQEVSFVMNNATTELPEIDSKFSDDTANKVTEKFPNHKPLAMITATNADKVNANMTKGEKTVTVKFTLPKSLVQSLVGDNYNLLKAYHIKTDGSFGDVDISIDSSSDPIVITVKGSGFSSYVIGYEEPEEEEIVSNGSGKDTGSGNYQYYPRDVSTNGIVDFGTSKVVKGMELPAGSSGKVTLNTKPTFAMPENGFYAFEIDAPGYNLEAKINGGLSFQIPEADLTAAGWTAKDIVLYHGTVAEDGKIIWEALPTNLVKNENGIAYYKSAINGCSPFYIGFVKDGSVVNTDVVDPVTPPTEEPTDVPGEILPEIPPVDEPETPATPAPVLGVLAALGAAVVLRRK